MKELVIASNNEGKIREIRSMIEGFQLYALADIGFSGEIPEPFETFEQNALTKAQAVHNFSGKNACADDSGLCVKALNGEPGVHSAYFGGLPRSDEKNNQRLLETLKDQVDRAAYYKAVICLIWDEQVYFFEGICEGRIAEAPVGTKGFGYDPLFIPDGYEHTFGELAGEVKNQISHRGKAIRKMVAFLKEHTATDEVFDRR